MKGNIKNYLKKISILEKGYLQLRGKRTTNTVDPAKIIKGENNIIKIDETTTLCNCTIDITGNENEIIINKSAIFNNVKFYIRGNNNKIKIGQKVTFNRGGLIWIEDYNGEAIIGENSTFEDVHIAVTEPYSKIIIGRECMFAYDIDIRTGDSHSIIDCTTNERINYAQNVIIGNHVWVASHVSILKGVHILDNSIVATRAVVTKGFDEKNILIGGIPAKKIKGNINWNRQRIYKNNDLKAGL